MSYAISRTFICTNFDQAPFSGKKKLALSIDAVAACIFFIIGLCSLMRAHLGTDLGAFNFCEKFANGPFSLPIMIALAILGFDAISAYRAYRWNQLENEN